MDEKCRRCGKSLKVEESNGLYFVGCSCSKRWFGSSTRHTAIDLWRTAMGQTPSIM